MRFATVCSGVGAPEHAWKPLGWEPVFCAEIEPFPSAVLAHHYPDVPNLGDFTTIDAEAYRDSVDILCAGTPCQSFSVAGQRGGLDDARGVLAFEFLRLAGRVRPRWIVFENVPGLLSSGGGRDFGAFLGALGKLGYGWSYRVLDAQFFGVAQRRRRVFVVGCLGDWRGAVAVLLEPSSLRRDTAPRREAGSRVAACATEGARSRGKGGYAGRRREDDVNIVFDPNQVTSKANRSRPEPGAPCHTVPGTPNAPMVAAPITANPCTYANAGNNPMPRNVVRAELGVRRLTPTEVERLFGLPDGYTDVPYRGKPAKDGPRYRALGNSMADPVLAWIGGRIALYEGLCPGCGAALEDDVCDRCDGPQDDRHLKFGERYEHKEDYP